VGLGFWGGSGSSGVTGVSLLSTFDLVWDLALLTLEEGLLRSIPCQRKCGGNSN
jgi:hypothetical protein